MGIPALPLLESFLIFKRGRYDLILSPKDSQRRDIPGKKCVIRSLGQDSSCETLKTVSGSSKLWAVTRFSNYVVNRTQLSMYMKTVKSIAF